MSFIQPTDIQLHDLGPTLAGHLSSRGYQSVSLEDIHPVDRDLLERRDRREVVNAGSILMGQSVRPDDFYLFDNLDGTLAYVRPNPFAPTTPHTIPFEIHFRTAAQQGFLCKQYHSLAPSQTILTQLLESLQSRGDSSIVVIAHMAKSGTLTYLSDQLDLVEDHPLPAHLFHSTYIGQMRKLDCSKEEAVDQLSKAMASVITATHLVSRNLINYYEAAAKVDELFLESALVG